MGIDENLLYNLRIYNSPKFHLIIDGNHSVLVPEMEALFRYYGFSYEIIRGTDRRDVSFEGKQPEPNKQNMKRLIDKVRNTKIKGKTVFGTASDPDGDRFFVSTQNGEYITPNEIGLIVLDNSLQNILNQMKLDLQAGTLTIEKIKSYQGTILKSHVTSAEIELLAQYYSRLFMEIAFGKDNVNLRTDERTNYVNAYNKGTFIPFAVESYPVGWKNLSGRQKQLESEGKRVIMSLESSGGLSLGLYDKDGGLATVLPFLIAAINGKDFDSMLSEIHKKAGLKSVFKETSVDNLTEEEKASFLSWINEFANYANVNEETKQVYRSTI
ncbi:MAG: hypothetical protein II816_05460, partial [Elusimicrobia bacterium]|nr:hypothetical protein [Elusimicrobiota bacterium]